MTTDKGDWPVLVVILSDGIRGHLFQSRGVAEWLSSITEAKIVELEVPLYRGWRRTWLLKFLAFFLSRGGQRGALNWLHWTGTDGLSLLDEYRRVLDGFGARGEDSLLISAGSSAAPFSLALSRVMGAKCCTLMTPSILGTGVFDYSIVPSHDGSAGSASLETLGAPNFITKDLVSREAQTLIGEFPPSPESGESWAILVGGNDRNYRLDSTWADMTVGVLLRIAEEQGMSLYITTSRRTPKETEEKIKSICRGNDRVAMLILASESDHNPVPGMLGSCGRIFCTEDSVSMISEAATSGSRVYLLRTGRQRGWRKLLQEITCRLIYWKILPERFLWGVPRFDRMIDAFIARGLLTEMPADVMMWRRVLERPAGIGPEFNEAERAARWILEDRG